MKSAHAGEIDAVVESSTRGRGRIPSRRNPNRHWNTGNEGVIDSRPFRESRGVAEVIRLSKPYN